MTLPNSIIITNVTSPKIWDDICKYLLIKKKYQWYIEDPGSHSWNSYKEGTEIRIHDNYMNYWSKVRYAESYSEYTRIKAEDILEEVESDNIPPDINIFNS